MSSAIHRLCGDVRDADRGLDPSRVLERGFDPARVLERAALPTVRGGDLMAMADIEKSIVNKPDWRPTRGVQRRDFAGTLAGKGRP